jgi:3-hydroxyacyl-[acyl-carrier-protein] dehydratase
VPRLDKQQICQLIPHRDPFLWIDEVVEIGETTLHARKTVDPDLDLFRGHYPAHPILPGVILCEAAMQAGALLIAHRGGDQALPAGHVPVATRINNVKFRQIVRPGDTIDIKVELTEQLAQAFYLGARITVSGKSAAQLDFACTVAAVE